MKRLAARSSLLLLTVLAACGGGADDDARVAATGDRAICLDHASWTANGDIRVESAPGDAQEIVGLRWSAHEGCERFVIDLAAAHRGDANGAGRVRAELLRDLGVVRVSLLDVPGVRTGATEGTMDGALVRGAYAVWSPEGRWTYVDLHLRESAEAHVSALASPARVVVDLRPSRGPVLAAPALSDRVVVLRPRAGEAEYPLEVVGYARTFEANVVARLVHEGQQVHESFTTATAWVDAWGHFTLTVPAGPSGRVTLHVGEYSAKDGSWEGAAVELNMR